MKKTIFFLLLMHTAFATMYAQTIKVTTTPTFCEGDGTATFTVSNAKIGATYDFELYMKPNMTTHYRLTSLVEPTSTTLTHVEVSLPKGDYTMQAVQNFNGTITTLPLVNFTISNNFVGITAQDISIKPTILCNNQGQITVIVAGNGNPAKYQLLDRNNVILHPYQASPTFGDELTTGDYRVAVEDACGNITVKDVSVTITTNIVKPSSNLTTSNLQNYLTSCNTINFAQQITGSSGSSTTPTYIQDYQYPVDVTIKVTGASRDELITGTLHNRTEASSGVPVQITDFNVGDQLTYSVSTKDACGAVFEASPVNLVYTPSFNLISSSANCGARFLSINTFRFFFKDSKTTVSFTEFPDEFKPWIYNQDFAEGEYTHIYDKFTNSTISFGSSSQPVPTGLYTVNISNECGASVTKSITISYTSSNQTLSVYSNPDCENGMYNIGFYHLVSPAVNIVEVVVTEAPEAFLQLFGISSLPFVIPAEYFVNVGNRIEFRMTVPEGKYTFDITNSCGQVYKDRTMNITSKIALTNSSVSYERFCGNFFSLSVSASFSGTSFAPYYYLQKWYPEAGAWGHPSTGVTGDISNANARYLVGTSNATFSNLNFHGDLRLIASPTVSKWGERFLCDDYFEVLKEFTIPKGSILLMDYYTFGSCDKGKFNLMVDATGMGTLSYEITRRNGEPFHLDNGNNPVFTNIPTGEYTVKVTDSNCGDALTADFKVITNKLPAIKAQELCEDEDGKLYVNGASFLTVEWYKDGMPTGVTGHNYNFTPYKSATDKGKYEAHLSHSSSAWCTEEPPILYYDLKPDIMDQANAGVGQTVIINRSAVADGLLNLFDYLDGPYDGHGEWIDLHNTGFLLGNQWYVNNIPGGTYRFKYQVLGTCDGFDETIVTIILIGANYWHGTVSTDWDNTENWTGGYVPATSEDIEFATTINNGPLGMGNNTGAAKRPLHLGEDKDRSIGNLINDSDQDLVISLGGMLTIEQEVKDNNANKGTIIVQADPEKATGTLYFADSSKNTSVDATVEFINRAYECATCGFYRKQWQYFGIPIESAEFPYLSPKVEIVNQWVEPWSADIYKWRPAPYPNGTELKAFVGYEMTNTGTRDAWRKLNGGTVTGTAGGQYQAVPFELVNQGGLPDRILSMHTFMLNVKTPGSITLEYSELIKNELINQTAWRYTKSAGTEIPHIVMEVIGSGSADRVWLFEKEGTTTEFDNGWDGYKMKEGDLIQAYVQGSDQSDYQVATVPKIEGTLIGIKAKTNEHYVINLSVTPEIESRKLYLHDLSSGRSYPIVNNAEYAISGATNATVSRFKVISSSDTESEYYTLSPQINTYVSNKCLVVENLTKENCTVAVYDLRGRLVTTRMVSKNETAVFTEISPERRGLHIVKITGESKASYKTDHCIL